MSDTTKSDPLRAIGTMFEWEPGLDCIIITNSPEAIRKITGDREIGELRHIAVNVGPVVVDGPTPESFAKQFDGREYGSEVTPVESIALKAAGMVAMFGYSDDCVEFRGVIHDETSSGKICITTTGRVLNEDQLQALQSLLDDGTLTKDLVPAVHTFKARHENDGWHITTLVPHAVFNVMESGEVFGRGIVFRISDLK
jgi:hypothetical protein